MLHSVFLKPLVHWVSDPRFLVGASLICLLGCGPTGGDNPATTAPAPEETEPMLPTLQELSAGDPLLPGLSPKDEAEDNRVELSLREVLAAKNSGYEPRTRHFREDGAPSFVNRLIRETSPYLLQHAHNPVNWYPWSDEAFARAKTEDKPVLLSVGYSTCHWCHVMEHESFEDPEIAALINERFVAIKVDREERPDVDDIYMKAVQLLTGRGGWPMTVVLTPEREPFFGGTYFPPRTGARGARRGFDGILVELSDGYANDRASMLARASELSQRIRQASQPARSGSIPGKQAVAAIAASFANSFDRTWGGFGRAPKFPRPVEFDVLLRAWVENQDPAILHMVTHTLEKIAAGGIHDHIGGGFHRYSTDNRWLVPHFEKMLYDNAQLAAVYTEAWQITKKPLFAATTRDILSYVLREMTTPTGAFYSATDADSLAPNGHMEEGLYFSWTPAEVRDATDETSAQAIIAWFAISESGNFEGRSIPFTPREPDAVAAELGIDVAELMRRVEKGRADLYAKRQERPAPLRDDKILASWNGMMISAFARAGLVFEEPTWTKAAADAAAFVLSKMRDEDGRLLRTHNEGRARHLGYLDDYAFVIAGLLDLYEATGDPAHLDSAMALQDVQDQHYADTPKGGYFTTAADAEKLIAREKPSYDGAEPSGNSAAALNLLRLAEFTQDQSYREKAENLFTALATSLGNGSRSAPLLATALAYYLDRPLELVVVKPSAKADDSAFLNQVRSRFLPHKVLVRTTSGEAASALSKRVPLVEGKVSRDGAVTGYVCELGHCEFPTTDPDVFGEQIERLRADQGGPGEPAKH